MAKQSCNNCGRILTNMDFTSGQCIMCKHPINENAEVKAPPALGHDINMVMGKGKSSENTKQCPKCGRLLSQDEKESGSCMICHYSFNQPGNPVSNNPTSEANKSITLTTAPSLEGYKITETIDVIAAECVIGMHFFKDLLSSFTDVFGGRSKTTQKTLREAKQTCLNELRSEAASQGANAVIGVDLDYSEISAQGKSMLFLVASGTAVKVESNG